ncbi:hypothetical protein J4526_07675 [Desulfurococcaceae archaeon MEX13E-LK6-19]|nr:hypothetical protein J4526_07675 [Desulfurococcaceae archaeon MEX13E-LK6-19]
MPSKQDILEKISSIRGTKKPFVQYLRRKGIDVSYNMTWDDIIDIVLGTRKVTKKDLERFLARYEIKIRDEVVVERERIIERERVRRRRERKFSGTFVYEKGMSLEEKFKYLVGLLEFDIKRWTSGAGGEIGDFIVIDKESNSKALVSCKNVSTLTIKHVNDLYANAIGFGFKHAILVIGKDTKLAKGCVERANYWGIQIVRIDDLEHNLLARKSVKDRISYLKTVLFASILRGIEEKLHKAQRMIEEKIRPTEKKESLQHLLGMNLAYEPHSESLDYLKTKLSLIHGTGFLRKTPAVIRVLKTVLVYVPYIIVKYSGKMKVGRGVKQFSGKIVVNANNGNLVGLSIEELVADLHKIKHAHEVSVHHPVKVATQINEKILRDKVIELITMLERTYFLEERGLLGRGKYYLTPKDLLKEKEVDTLDEAINEIENEEHGFLIRTYKVKRSDIKIESMDKIYLPYWCIEYEVPSKNFHGEAYGEAYISEPEPLTEPCPWK